MKWIWKYAEIINTYVHVCKEESCYYVMEIHAITSDFNWAGFLRCSTTYNCILTFLPNLSPGKNHTEFGSHLFADSRHFEIYWRLFALVELIKFTQNVNVRSSFWKTRLLLSNAITILEFNDTWFCAFMFDNSECVFN